MTVATKYPELPELYLLNLAENANRSGFADCVADAVIDAAACGGSPDGPDLVQAAGKLTRHAMGLLEHTVSLISTDQLDGPIRWQRIDAFFSTSTYRLRHPESDYSPAGTEEQIKRAEAELTWVALELMIQASRCFELHFDYASPDGSRYNGGLHLAWAKDLEVAGACLNAAVKLLQELQGLEQEEEE